MRAADSPLSSVSTQPSIANSLGVWAEVQATLIPYQRAQERVEPSPNTFQTRHRRKRGMWIICATLFLGLLGIAMTMVAVTTFRSVTGPSKSDVQGTMAPTTAPTYLLPAPASTKPSPTSSTQHKATTSMPSSLPEALSLSDDTTGSKLVVTNQPGSTLPPPPPTTTASRDGTPNGPEQDPSTPDTQSDDPSDGGTGTKLIFQIDPNQTIQDLNYIRSALGYKNLSWNFDEALKMESWSKLCTHGSPQFGGERPWTSNSNSTNVLDWYLIGHYNWDYSNKSCLAMDPEVCLHFRTILNRNIQQIGCGYAYCNSMDTIWCSFTPLKPRPLPSPVNPPDDLASLIDGYHLLHGVPVPDDLTEPTIQFPSEVDG